MIKILFVCHGNICRSPMAEFVMKDLVKKAGLEKEFNKNLTGTPGVWRLMFDEDGNKILDELQIRPKPGGAVVTTLNLKWQKDAERILSRGKRRGGLESTAKP